MTKVLFLHGYDGHGRGPKSIALDSAGFTLAPPPDLPYPDMHGAIALAQQVHDQHRPDVIVGSSLGGAVALQLQTTAGLVLMAPATEASPLIKVAASLYGLQPKPLTPRSIVIQSRDDEQFSFRATESLIRKVSEAASPSDRETINRIEQDLVAAGYQPLAGRLIEAGCDHQLNRAAEGTPPSLHPHAVMVKAVQILAAI